MSAMDHSVLSIQIPYHRFHPVLPAQNSAFLAWRGIQLQWKQAQLFVMEIVTGKIFPAVKVTTIIVCPTPMNASNTLQLFAI